ncbi:hypothetical protein GQR58_024251 [Nymphon striatum]|nr:hypothetical protein GQR58_024251 [Nymphon striatum]
MNALTTRNSSSTCAKKMASSNKNLPTVAVAVPIDSSSNFVVVQNNNQTDQDHILKILDSILPLVVEHLFCPEVVVDLVLTEKRLLEEILGILGCESDQSIFLGRSCCEQSLFRMADPGINWTDIQAWNETNHSKIRVNGKAVKYYAAELGYDGFKPDILKDILAVSAGGDVATLMTEMSHALCVFALDHILKILDSILPLVVQHLFCPEVVVDLVLTEKRLLEEILGILGCESDQSIFLGRSCCEQILFRMADPGINWTDIQAWNGTNHSKIRVNGKAVKYYAAELGYDGFKPDILKDILAVSAGGDVATLMTEMSHALCVFAVRGTNFTILRDSMKEEQFKKFGAIVDSSTCAKKMASSNKNLPTVAVAVPIDSSSNFVVVQNNNQTDQDPRIMAKDEAADSRIFKLKKVLRTLVEAERLEKNVCDDAIREYKLYIFEILPDVRDYVNAVEAGKVPNPGTKSFNTITEGYPRIMAKDEAADSRIYKLKKVLRTLVEAERLEENVCDDAIREYKLYIFEGGSSTVCSACMASYKSRFCQEIYEIEGKTVIVTDNDAPKELVTIFLRVYITPRKYAIGCLNEEDLNENLILIGGNDDQWKDVKSIEICADFGKLVTIFLRVYITPRKYAIGCLNEEDLNENLIIIGGNDDQWKDVKSIEICADFGKLVTIFLRVYITPRKYAIGCLNEEDLKENLIIIGGNDDQWKDVKSIEICADFGSTWNKFDEINPRRY